MEKKFKVASYAWYGTQWTKTFYTFEEAKLYFREKMVSPEMVPHIVDHINEYAKEHYPENTPKAFSQLAEIITNILTDPNYPKSIDDIEIEHFFDDNIEFYGDGKGGIFCYVNNDEYDGKFPLAEINIFNMDDENAEYFFFLTEKRDGMCWSQNKELTPIGEDEAADDEDGFDIDFDDIDDYIEEDED